MWQTARDESIAAQQMMQTVASWSMAALAAVVAAISFLATTSLSADWVRLVGWAAIFFLGALGGTQYMQEAKRMLRAGRFAFETEKLAASKGWSQLPEKYLWEHHLQGLRFIVNYDVTAAAAILALLVAQAVPFLIYPAAALYIGPFGFWPYWVPILGAAFLLVYFVVDYRLFRRQLAGRWGPGWS